MSNNFNPYNRRGGVRHTINLKEECSVNDLVWRRVWFDTPDLQNPGVMLRNVPHQIPAFITEVYKSYLVVFCAFNNKYLKVSQNLILDFEKSVDDVRGSARIPHIGKIFNPVLIGPGKPKKIITL